MKGEVVRSAREPRTLLGSGPALSVKRGGREALPAPPPAPSAAVPAAGEPGRESVVSAEFFQEGERQEALGWKDSPLVSNATSSEAPVEFSSFDRVPKRRAPLVMTTVVVALALLAGLGAEALRGKSSHAWVVAHAGPRATHAWGRARSEWVTLKARGAALTGGEPASAVAPAFASAGTAATATPGVVALPPVDAAPETATHDQSTAVSRAAPDGPTATSPRDRPRAPVATARISSPRRREAQSLRAREPVPRRPLSSWAQAELAMAPAGGPPVVPPAAFPPASPSAAEPSGEGAAAGAVAVPMPASPAPETAPPPFEGPAPEPAAAP